MKNQWTKEDFHGAGEDAFWTPDESLPQKKPVFHGANADTDPVEISVERDFSTARRLVESRPLYDDGKAGEQAVPKPGGSFSGSRHTPGDVRPVMSEPVCTYTPEHSLLEQVSIWRWPAKYHFFDRFYTDALRYFDRDGEEVPYVPFYAYVPQYYMMNAEQLRYYLYWRGRVREGIYLQSDYSYLFLYLYEIINLPDKIPPRRGLEQMLGLWLAYRESFLRLDRYLGEWVCDYCLCNRLTPPTDALSGITGELFDKVSLKEFYIRIDREDASPFTPSLVDALTDYDWHTSKCLNKEVKGAFRHHYYPAVIGALDSVWKEQEDYVSLLGLTRINQTRDAFAGAICTHNVKRRIDIRLLSVSRSYQFRCVLTLLCKFTENCIRAHFGIRSRLSCQGLDEKLKTFVRAYFDAHLPSMAKQQREKREAERALARSGNEPDAAYAHLYEADKTPLSPEDAMKIENASWAVTALLTREQAPGESPEPAQTPRFQTVAAPAQTAAQSSLPAPENAYEEWVMGLGETAYEALKAIINGDADALRTICSAGLTLPEALVGALNDSAVEVTGDVAVEEGEGFPRLCDDYANDITNAVIKREEA